VVSRVFAFVTDGSGSISIRRPFSSLYSKRLNATGTSATSAISTKPNPQQSLENQTGNCQSGKTSPAREKLRRKISTVTAPAGLSTYTFGIQSLLPVQAVA
jgi:hypothetical protein